MRIRLSTAFVVLLLSAVPGVPADAADEVRLLEMVNIDRIRRALDPLEAEPEASEVARRHSTEMLGASRIYHDSPVNGTVEKRLAGVSFFFSKVGENVAEGFDLHLIHSALMDSPNHRRNILDPDYTHAGIGIAELGGTIFVTEVFITKIPQQDPATLATALLERLDAYRRNHRLPTLRRDPSLSGESARLAASMLTRDSKEPGELQLVPQHGSLRICSFVGPEPAWDVIEGQSLKNWESAGAGVVQGRTARWPHGANWYVVIFRGN